MAGTFILGSSLLFAKSGVLVHKLDGSTVFYPSDGIQYVEFVEDYDDSELPENPNEDGSDNEGKPDDSQSGETDQPGTPDDSNSEEPENPGNTENPGDQNGSDNDNPSSGDNSGSGNEGGENPSDPTTPDGGDNNNSDPGNQNPPVDSGTTDPEDPQPSTPDDNNPGNTPSEPGDSEDNSGSTDTPDDTQDPDQPEDPGDKPSENPENPGDNPSENPETPGDDPTENPETPGDDPTENPENPGDDPSEIPGDNPSDDPQNPGEDNNPTVKAFTLYSESSLKLNETYLIVYNNICASTVAVSNSYGYLPSATVSISNNTIEGNQQNGYLFTNQVTVNGTTYNAAGDKFLIKDSNGRYLYLSGTYTSFNLADNPTVSSNKIDDAFLFSATKTNDGRWKISNTRSNDTRYLVYSTKYNNFAAYSSLSNSDYYPYLYILGDYIPGEDNNSGNNSGDQGNNSGSNGGTGNDVVPDDFKFPLTYVALPEGTPQQVKEYTSFTLNFNKDNHTANYVAWELLSSETTGSANRNNYNYWVDKDLEGCLSTDFAYSTYSYERGHMCPAADNKWSGAAMKDCMVMANMCPQLRQLNSGLWSTLEEKEREWAKRFGSVWIVAGPLYSDTDTLYVGGAKARVASAYFKAFLYNDNNNPKAIAFVFQNGSNPGNLKDYAISIDQLEEETGYDFFSALPDDIENVIEATCNFSDWN